MPSKDSNKNFALIRDRILEKQGREYWRSLEEFADTEEFHEFIRREYPHQADEWDSAVSRRSFLKVMGASLALAGITACAYKEPEKIVPYVQQPEDVVPGMALFFATGMTMAGVTSGLLVKSNEGRPTKIEGNPDHPNAGGLSATDLFAQASLLTMYDPDRSQTLTFREEIRPWNAFVGDMRTRLDAMRPTGGAGLRFLTETIVSPTIADQFRIIMAEYPQAKWHQYEPASSSDSVRAGAVQAFGRPVNTVYHFERATRILALDADFLSCGPGNLWYARDFAGGRRATPGATDINRLYAVESTPSNTGMKADHRLSLRPSEIEGFARAVATAMGVNAGPSTYSGHANWIAAMVRDLQAHRGSALVVAGAQQSPAVHVLAHAMNAALGAVGSTLVYTDPIEAVPADQTASLRDLLADIDRGQVEMLVILGGNPVYTTPVDLKLDPARLDKVKMRVHLSLFKDETSVHCHWHIPEAHYLESWGDGRSYDGTVTISQPLISPLYDGKSALEVLSVFSNQMERPARDILRFYWRNQRGPGATPGARPAATAARPAPGATPTPDPFDDAWRKIVHDGFIPNTALPATTPALNPAATTAAPQSAPSREIELVFRPDPTIFDGRFANNGWLQELPKPLTKLTWENVALISPAMADRLNLNQGAPRNEENPAGITGRNLRVDVVELTYRGRTLKNVPVWVMPGQPDNVVTIHFGYGRERAGRVGNDIGFDAYRLRTSDAPWFGSGVQIRATGERADIASTQLHFNMENRGIVQSGTLADYLKKPENVDAASQERTQEESMYPRWDYESQPYAWGMTIDLSSCVGCYACVVACQSENNIPVVGKEQVLRNREMQWLRVDSYFKGNDPNNPEGQYFMPVPCMHCEQAPCEPVCPVHATVHSSEGLNDMVYNRCVGTRYCSNNCPYKVRRFNFLLYQDWDTPTYKLMRNPEVSIRSRGVMEKCTYCVQRIQWAKIEADKENRVVRDGEVVTACQAVCPAQAIVFGNLKDPGSRVSQLKASPRTYSLLEDLDTKPRTTYLADLRNPNPEITERA